MLGLRPTPGDLRVTELPCTRCGAAPRRPRQRWCLDCSAAYKRERRAGVIDPALVLRQKPGERGTSVPSTIGDDLAPFVPYLGHDDVPREPWVDVFLRATAKTGGAELAAAEAGVHRSVVRRRRQTDAGFAEEEEAALEHFRDRTEWESLQVGRLRKNPLPFFARLKAERPGRYVEKATLAVVNVPADTPGPAEARALLLEMLKSTTPTTRRMLAEEPERGLAADSDQTT